MTEAEQRQKESPLRTDRGVTTIKDTVVSKIAGLAAGDVEGVHMGGGAARSAGGLLEGITGSDSTTRGVSVEVGSIETAIDLKMGIDYDKNILGTVGEVRQKITERVQNMTGLKVTELNVTIADVILPDDNRGNGSRKGIGAGSGTESGSGTAVEARTMPRTELRPGASEREATPVEPRSRTYTEGSSGPVPEEEVRAEGKPVDEDEIRWLGADEVSSTSESSTSESGAATGSGDAGTTRSEGGAAEPDDRTQEIDRERVSEAEERRARRRRRREEG